jgi:hypothetical protein
MAWLKNLNMFLCLIDGIIVKVVENELIRVDVRAANDGSN